MKARWIVSAILASAASAFAQVEQGQIRLPEIAPVAAGALPVAPEARRIAIVPMRRKYAQVIEPQDTGQQFTSTDKMIFSFTEVARPITLFPALYSAGYEQIFNTDPKYGHDAGAFGEKFGASMLRSASVRVFSDGVLASAFHQDPRYYRIGEGSVIHRGVRSAMQAVIRRGDDGAGQINFSGIGGRAAAAALTVTYYPQPSVTAAVVTSTFLISILSDAGGDLLLEFFPNVAGRFPILRRLHAE